MLNAAIHTLQAEATSLLRQLIAIPSFSKEEDRTAALLEQYLRGKGIPAERLQNNIWAKNKYFDPSKPTLLLNSHHDTVKPNKAYTLDPFSPIEKEGKLYGLGSNDAGGALVSLIAVFIYFYGQKDLTHNILLAATAEEEISGHQGIELLIPAPGKSRLGSRGRTNTNAAGRSGKRTIGAGLYRPRQGRSCSTGRGRECYLQGHARYRMVPQLPFPKVSGLLGPVKTSVTVINTDNKAHNVVPSACHFVVDVRVNELYTFEEILDIIRRKRLM